MNVNLANMLLILIIIAGWNFDTLGLLPPENSDLKAVNKQFWYF